VRSQAPLIPLRAADEQDVQIFPAGRAGGPTRARRAFAALSRSRCSAPSMTTNRWLLRHRPQRGAQQPVGLSPVASAALAGQRPSAIPAEAARVEAGREHQAALAVALPDPASAAPRTDPDDPPRNAPGPSQRHCRASGRSYGAASAARAGPVHGPESGPGRAVAARDAERRSGPPNLLKPPGPIAVEPPDEKTRKPRVLIRAGSGLGRFPRTPRTSTSWLTFGGISRPTGWSSTLGAQESGRALSDYQIS